MRFWLHGHNGLPAHLTRCTSTSATALAWWSWMQQAHEHAPCCTVWRLHMLLADSSWLISLHSNDEAGRFAAGGGSLLTVVAAAVEQWRQTRVVSPQK